ncbi:MAG TPA: hypothetical protein PLS29_00810 [Acidimicrobiales bacterium]|nr:hypothetical protein [Acidimicrobiales bacterium]
MIVRRAFRLLLATVFGRALAGRSRRWAAVGGGLVLLRVLDRLASRPTRRSRERT